MIIKIKLRQSNGGPEGERYVQSPIRGQSRENYGTATSELNTASGTKLLDGLTRSTSVLSV